VVGKKGRVVRLWYVRVSVGELGEGGGGRRGMLFGEMEGESNWETGA
jgi:hypothetical protein